jgi:hypothetical protein
MPRRGQPSPRAAVSPCHSETLPGIACFPALGAGRGGVMANCAHPGVVRTGFGRESRPLLKLGITIARPFMLSPERGADTIMYLASSPDVAGQTAGYYVKRQRREPSAAARDDTVARELWELSERMTGLAPARAAGN